MAPRRLSLTVTTPRLTHQILTGAPMNTYETHLAHVRVHDAMHTGILTTDPTTPLQVVAGLMADQRVHAIAIADPDHVRRPSSIVTALDVTKAAIDGGDVTAAQAVTAELVTVSAAAPLDVAARMMAQHNICHLLVVDPATGHATGFLSALDVAAAYAG